MDLRISALHFLRIGLAAWLLAALAACGAGTATPQAAASGDAATTTLAATPANPPPPGNAPPPAPPPPDGNQQPPNPPPPDQPPAGPPPPANPPAADLDQQLRDLINAQGLTGDPSRGRRLPEITSPAAQLGMRLFFSRSLGGNFEAACASCHHPALAGGDELSLPVGVGALDPALLGAGRSTASGLPQVPRNAPTTFNIALWNRFLFDDGRIERLPPPPGANAPGAGGAIRTPDSNFGQPDPEAGPNLPAAQSRFPVASVPEMRSEDFLPGAGNAAVRDHLAARLGNYGVGAGELARNEWLPLFQQAFDPNGDAQSLVTYAHIGEAIAAYERSQLFVDTAWREYVAGNNAAMSAAAKRGAILFLRPANQNGAGCSGCHRGDFFTDENFHTIAIPQFGPGKGDGATGDDDFGRGRESGNPDDRYQFRTPALLNIALTAPYDHDGAFATLTEVVRHYRNPQASATNYVANRRWCQLPQFAGLPHEDCAALYPNAAANTQAALDKLQADRQARRRALPPININDGQIADIVSFLNTLTDRCAADRACLAQWIPLRDGGPDGQQLDAVDQHGDNL